MDLADPVAGCWFKDCHDPTTDEPCYTSAHSRLSSTAVPPGEWLGLFDLSNVMRATLVDLIHDGGPVTGVFAPACFTHTGLTNSNFTQQTVQNFDEGIGMFTGVGTTLDQALLDWLVNGGPVRVIDAAEDSGVLSSSVCDGEPG